MNELETPVCMTCGREWPDLRRSDYSEPYCDEGCDPRYFNPQRDEGWYT